MTVLTDNRLVASELLVNTNKELQLKRLSGALNKCVEESAPAFQWVGGVKFVSSNPRDACDRVIALGKERLGRHIHLANAYTVALADKSVEYRQVLAAPALVFPDGRPIGWISRLRGQTPRLAQVRGPQLFLDVLDHGRSAGIRHYLLGSTPEVLALLESRLTKMFPGIRIVGVESPPFRPVSAVEYEAQDERIRSSEAHIVWVGLGTPKQDVEAQRLSGSVPVVAIAIGAAFDFAAGTLPEAPVWVRKIGMEWSYRLLREPKRLWKRYFFGNARFLKAAVVHRGPTVDPCR